MVEENSEGKLEGKVQRDRNLEIYFEIAVPNPMNNPYGMKTYCYIMPVLKFQSSNYKLSNDEKERASLRPNCLFLDDNVAYVKTNESAYLKDEKNILKINYCMYNHMQR